MWTRFLCTAIIAVALVGKAAADPGLTFTQAFTDEQANVNFSFKLTEAKLKATDWLVTLVIDGNNIDPKKCTLGQKCGGEIGGVVAPLKLAVGKYKVTIKVVLSDNTTLEKKDVEVEFKKMGCGPCIADWITCGCCRHELISWGEDCTDRICVWLQEARKCVKA